MRRVLLILSVAVAGVYAISIMRTTIGPSNIDQRQKYWAGEISRSLAPGATLEELTTFAKSHGQALRCYQDQRREHKCRFDDPQSKGGTSNLPVQLAVIFSMRDNKMVSHELAPVPAQRE